LALTVKKFPRPIDLTLSEDDLLTEDLFPFQSCSIPNEHQSPDLLDPLDPQELIEDQLLILITDFLFKTYPSSPQSRVEVLLNVAEVFPIVQLMLPFYKRLILI
jgi:hypothetical protein